MRDSKRDKDNLVGSKKKGTWGTTKSKYLLNSRIHSPRTTALEKRKLRDHFDTQDYSFRVIIYKVLLKFPHIHNANLMEEWKLDEIRVTIKGLQEGSHRLDLLDEPNFPDEDQIKSLIHPKTFERHNEGHNEKIKTFDKKHQAVAQKEFKYGVSSIDMRYSKTINAKDLAGLRKNKQDIHLVIHFKYSNKEAKQSDRNQIQVVAKVDLSELMKKWLNEEWEYLEKDTTTANDFDVKRSGWRGKENSSVKLMDVRNNTQKPFEVESQVGELYFRIDLLNQQKYYEEKEKFNCFKPFFSQEKEIEQVLRGKFSYNIAQHFFETYADKEQTDTALWSTLNELMKLCTPEAYELFMDLKCIHSQNPIVEVLKGIIYIQDKIYLLGPEKFTEKAQWRAVRENCEKRATKYLDLFHKLPKGFRYDGEQEGLLKAIPGLALTVKSSATAAHPFIHGRLVARWNHQENVKIFGKRVPCIPKGSLMEKVTTPKCSFLLQVVAYTLFLFFLVWPILETKEDRTVFFEQYINLKLLVGMGGNTGGGNDFKEVCDIPSWWNWVNSDLVNIFEPPERYAFMSPIGNPTIRQFRVLPQPCQWSEGECQPELQRLMVNWETGDTSSQYKSTMWSSTVGYIITGTKLISLPSGGYYSPLSPNNRTLFLETLYNLQQEEWIDKRTRAVVIDITLYTANDNIFAMLTLCTEFTDVGVAIPSAFVSILKQEDLVSGFDILSSDKFWVHFLVLLCVIGWLAQELNKMLVKSDYWTYGWNYYELVLYVCVFIIFVIEFQLPGSLDPYTTDDETLRIWWLRITAYQTTKSLIILMAFFRVIFYMRLNHITGPLVVATYKMMNDIFNYLMLAFVIIFAFAQVFVSLFCDFQEIYIDIWSSLYVLLQATFGKFAFVDMIGGVFSYTVGNTMLVLYLLLSLILLVNLLIAMLNKTYELVQHEALGGWGLQFAALVLHYESVYWPPPFNLVYILYILIKSLFKMCIDWYNKKKGELPPVTPSVLSKKNITKTKTTKYIIRLASDKAGENQEIEDDYYQTLQTYKDHSDVLLNRGFDPLGFHQKPIDFQITDSDSEELQVKPNMKLLPKVVQLNFSQE